MHLIYHNGRTWYWHLVVIMMVFRLKLIEYSLGATSATTSCYWYKYAYIVNRLLTRSFKSRLGRPRSYRKACCASQYLEILSRGNARAHSLNDPHNYGCLWINFIAFFFNAHRRYVCTWYLYRGQDGRIMSSHYVDLKRRRECVGPSDEKLL